VHQPFVVSNKRVAYKQLAAGMYSPLSYALAHTIVQAPLSFIETAVTSLIAYPMVGLVLDGGRWVYFFFVLWLLNMANGSLLRVFAYAARTLEEAQTAPAGFVALQVLFSGFMIAVKLMGWMKFLYYVSLLGYSLHALAINEFQAPKYTELLQPVSAALAAAHFAAHPQDAALPMSQLCAAGAFPCASASTLILQALSLSARPGWRYAEVGFLVGGVLIVCNLLGGAIMSLPVVTNVGASRAQPPAEKERDETESAAIAAPAPAAVAVAIAPAAPVALPFTPMTVVWRDLCYAVTLRDGSSKQLLHGITGVALPGRCQALMGPSGGGKTTLLDVLSGRKNVGVVTGDIHLNGFPSNKKTFARLMAYGEQQDAHTAQATVGESLLFAAALRLERRITPAQRTAFCDEVLALLRLDSLRHRIVGEPGSTDGLGGAERKMLTIAVELASNAPILFLGACAAACCWSHVVLLCRCKC
jgi:ABC-type multidrug transport system fused ATPase/permease subunit